MQFYSLSQTLSKKSDLVSASRSASCKELYLVRSKKTNTSFSTYNVEVCHRRCAMSSMLTIAPEWTRAWDMCTACKADQNEVPKFCRRDLYIYIYQLLFSYHYLYIYIWWLVEMSFPEVCKIRRQVGARYIQ